MICEIILSKGNGKYVARAKEWPEVAVQEDTRDKAISGIRTRLADYLTNEVEVLQIEVPVAVNGARNPWLDGLGTFADDPTFDDLQAEIAAYRREIDEQMAQVQQ